MTKLTPGCTLHADPSPQYFPLVIEAHSRIYFSGRSYDNPASAIRWAAQSIAVNDFRDWHSHPLTGGE